MLIVHFARSSLPSDRSTDQQVVLFPPNPPFLLSPRPSCCCQAASVYICFFSSLLSGRLALPRCLAVLISPPWLSPPPPPPHLPPLPPSDSLHALPPLLERTLCRRLSGAFGRTLLPRRSLSSAAPLLLIPESLRFFFIFFLLLASLPVPSPAPASPFLFRGARSEFGDPSLTPSGAESLCIPGTRAIGLEYNTRYEMCCCSRRLKTHGTCSYISF